MSRERVELGQGQVGERLDRAIVAALRELGRELSRSQLARAFAAGQVTIEGRPAKPSATLASPCTIELELLPPEPLAHARPEPIELAIVHEDGDLLIVDKPAGMVVHAGPGHEQGTLVNALLHHLGAGVELPVLPGNGPERPGIVHRLDRDTSGLLVIAKHLAAQEALARQFRVHSIERAYLGVVAGVPEFETRRIETSHGRDPAERRRFAPDQGERRAITIMTVVERFGDRAALVRFELETGRTHQIRMHARFVGTPIFADPLYGFRLRDPDLRQWASELGRHALHATLLGFEHPRGGRLRFESPLPGELEALVVSLRG
ncbi:RluA family pseudouridine synthase [Nannocystaceae bacterium ST9]